MRFVWCFSLIALAIIAMENPTPVANVRKYSCCPEKFGYHFVQMNTNNEGRENIHLCDFEESKACSDDARVRIPNRLFKRLLIELITIQNERARESYARLVERLQKGAIVIGGEITQLSHKDMCHRIFSHLRACKDGEWEQIAMQGYLIRPFFLGADDKPSCIHRFVSIFYQYPSDQEQMLFGEVVAQEFETIRPFPSLVALAARAINGNNIVANVPQDLQDLIHRKQ